MVGISFYGWSFLFWFFHVRYKLMKYTCYTFSLVSLALLQSSCYYLFVYFRRFCCTPITQMFSLNGNWRVTYENCGTQLHKKSLSSQEEMFNWNTLLHTISYFFNNVPGSLQLTESTKVEFRSRHEILIWILSLKMSMIQNWKKKWTLANISSCTPSLKKVHTMFLISPCLASATFFFQRVIGSNVRTTRRCSQSQPCIRSCSEKFWIWHL